MDCLTGSVSCGRVREGYAFHLGADASGRIHELGNDVCAGMGCGENAEDPELAETFSCTRSCGLRVALMPENVPNREIDIVRISCVLSASDDPDDPQAVRRPEHPSSGLLAPANGI